MKFIFIVLSLLLVMNCVSQKPNTEISNKGFLKDVTSLYVIYEARTRGSSKILYVLGDEVTYKNNKRDEVLRLSSEVKKELVEIISKIDLEKIKFLKSPTNKRMFDGAMHAVVKIKKDDKEYISSNFDDGYPPEALKYLVDVLMKIVE